MSKQATLEPVEAVAKALWESESHLMLERAGIETDWAKLDDCLKRSMYRKARIAIKAYNEALRTGNHTGAEV